MKNTSIIVLIPAYNEQDAIGKVIHEIPDFVDKIIVCNNGSKDNTKAVAEEAGAIVVTENTPGYGNACLKGMAYLVENELKPDIVVFLDGDYSDYPAEMSLVVAPIIEQDVDLVIGSRALGNKEKGSMTVPQVFGNWLSTRLIRLFYRVRFTDLGPFRAIKYDRLLALNMSDKTYGWTVEMQIKAAKQKLKCTEVAVNYKKRIGVSKVSGTIKGTFLAGFKIIGWILKSIF